MNVWASFRRYQASNIILVFGVLQVILILTSLIHPNFAYCSIANFESLLKTFPPLGIIAIGVGLLMIAGEFDISVGSIFLLASYMMALAYNAGLPVGFSILLALAIGVLAGLLNAVLTIKGGMPSFIATLGTMQILRGIVLIVSDGASAAFRPNAFVSGFFSGSIGSIQASFIWLLIIAGIAYLLLERHKLGNHIYAVGGNRATAFAVGVNPNRIKAICFVITGVLAALAGVISAVRVSSISPTQGAGFELQAIAVCVIGGLSLSGGVGSIIGVFLGTCLLLTIQNVLNLLGIPGAYNDFFIGLLIVLAVIFNNLTKKD